LARTPSRRRFEPRAWIAALAALVVVGLVWVDLDRASPGPISATHAGASGLDSEASCSACHGGIFQSMRSACVECHAGIAEDIEAGTGLHGTLRGVDPNECGGCHFEHHGRDFRPTTRASFAFAGIPDPKAYDHESLDFTLGGRHLELDCVECHEAAELQVLPEGTSRFRGLEKACESCHEDVHEGRMAMACADCHGQVHAFAEVREFVHTQGFEAEGAHAEPACVECHEKDGEHAVEVLAGRGPKPRDRDCIACHESPHDRGFVAQVAADVRIRPGATCAECHSSVHASFTGQGDEMEPDLHAASGFALVPPHDVVACADCHAADEPDAEFAARYPGRDAETCESCHQDPHQGEFGDGTFAGEGCLECHDRLRFQPSAFAVEDHARTEFELAGSHAAVACEACHELSAQRTLPTVDDAPPPCRFDQVESACSACHADAHRRAFEDVLADLPEDERDCGLCHGTELFEEVPDFDHERFTAYALEGAHVRADCESCHRPTPTPDRLGRSFGFVEEVFGGPVEDCASCHADPHDGLFDADGRPAVVAGERGCERCHVVEAFDELRGGSFDHLEWTGYDNGGAHAGLDCAACHAEREVPDALGRRFERALGTACEDCHSDPHVGQFAVNGSTECARCHEDNAFVDFDHQSDSRYALDARHAVLECSACHVPWPLPSGGTAVRYKPLGVECADCHAGDVR